MKYIFAVLVLIGSVFAQNTTYKDGTDCNCDSINRSYYESGEILEETPYKNGDIHGTIVSYYGSTELIHNIPYNIRMRIEYKNGKRHGVRYINFLNGDYSYTEFYKGNAYSERIYYKSNQLKEEIPYDGYHKNGIVKWYLENGELAGTATYKTGKLLGYKKCTDGRFGNESLDCLN